MLCCCWRKNSRKNNSLNSPFTILRELCSVQSHKARVQRRASHTPNHTPEPYPEPYLRFIPLIPTSRHGHVKKTHTHICLRQEASLCPSSRVSHGRMRVFSGGVHEESPIHIEVQAEQPTAGRPSGEFESHGWLSQRDWSHLDFYKV